MPISMYVPGFNSSVGAGMGSSVARCLFVVRPSICRCIAAMSAAVSIVGFFGRPRPRFGAASFWTVVFVSKPFRMASIHLVRIGCGA